MIKAGLFGVLALVAVVLAVQRGGAYWWAAAALNAGVAVWTWRSSRRGVNQGAR